MADQDLTQTDTVTFTEALERDIATTDTFYAYAVDGGPNDAKANHTSVDQFHAAERFRVNKGSFDYNRPYRAEVEDRRSYAVIHATPEAQEYE